ncbi:MAG: methylenetetrahydrofolate--tRNA-(uracil(54)-C(5))-methyltransferase (FADH(2)-oxidizing) TrmFO [Polyangiaceae bacterium]|nr:methylenetetrahydrofolate--tRNA-(uracil(54)-C(5))-methyltransferase (FADH(2)-oxidizing) TrmFO [Polyangiaceae bacterium]
MTHATVVGAGLAGCEAAYQLAERGVRVTLLEMKPEKRTPAQTSDWLCELVCSNSMRGSSLTNAVGLLKEELRRMGSIVLRVADRTQVPAGGALAVDREKFAEEMTRTIASHPNIEVVAREVTRIPDERPVILATGPLTADDLARDIEAKVGGERLAYYDAIAPIVAADSINWDKVWKQSRYGKGIVVDPDREGMGEATDGGDEAYVNCPFDEEGYKAFVRALVEAEKVAPRAFEEVKYFEGCLPCEVMAERGELTLAYGPMKPVGLTDPRTGRRPFAVIQLRQEDEAATAYNLVGFQTRMKFPEQMRVFRMIPGLEEAEIQRFGSVHRNTFLDAPSLLDETMQLRPVPGVYVAGQLSGVEGYVESAAGGFLCSVLLAARLNGRELVLPPRTTALGGILTHLGRPGATGKYQPSNITWAHLPPLEGAGKKLKKRDRYAKLAERALADLGAFAAASGVASAA